MSEQVPMDESGSGINFRLVLGGLATLALGLFVFQNTDDVQVNFLWADWSLPLALLLVITVALTLVISVMVTWILRRRSNRS